MFAKRNLDRPVRWGARSFAAAAGLTAALGAPPAHATYDNVDLRTFQPKQIVVVSNGSSYTQLKTPTAFSAVIDVLLIGGLGQKVKNWKAWAIMAPDEPLDSIEFTQHGFGKSYKIPRPMSVDRTDTIEVPASAYGPYVLGLCNGQASILRQNGLSDHQIFSEDRTIMIRVGIDYRVEFTGLFDSPPALTDYDNEKIELVCQKWQGSSAPVATSDLNTQLPEVKSGSLTVIEQYGPSGLCSLQLSGVIETYEANTEVKFRYEDDDGHKSDVKTVKTDHSKTVMFSHKYEIANNPNGGENGKVRMVGVGNPLKTAWNDYSMNCVKPGATGFTAELPPIVKMQWVVAEQKAFPIQDNLPGAATQLCPVRLKLIGVIEGRGQMSGKAIFYGDNYLSPMRSYEVENGQKVLIGAEREIDWTAALAFSNGPAKRTISLGLNVTGSDPSNIVASVPKKTEWLTCTKVAAVPGLQGGGGLTVGSEPVQPSQQQRQLKAVESGPTPPKVLQFAPDSGPKPKAD